VRLAPPVAVTLPPRVAVVEPTLALVGVEIAGALAKVTFLILELPESAI